MTFSGPFSLSGPASKSSGRDGFRPVCFCFFHESVWFKVEISFPITRRDFYFQILPEGRGHTKTHPVCAEACASG